MTANDSRRDQLAALLTQGRVIPVITIVRVEDAVPLARALVKGGIRLLEITLRTAAGLAGAQAIIREVPDAIVGIGTVLTPDDLKRSIDIGARFALSPGATAALLDAAAAAPIPFLPGIATASELMEAMARGFDTAKFFPATSAGGLTGLKALADLFPTRAFAPPAASRGQCRRMAGTAQCGGGGRLVADASGRDRRRAMGRDPRPRGAHACELRLTASSAPRLRIFEMDCLVTQPVVGRRSAPIRWLLAAVMPRACASSTPRPFRSIVDVSRMLDRPVEPDEDGGECGA